MASPYQRFHRFSSSKRDGGAKLDCLRVFKTESRVELTGPISVRKGEERDHVRPGQKLLSRYSAKVPSLNPDKARLSSSSIWSHLSKYHTARSKLRRWFEFLSNMMMMIRSTIIHTKMQMIYCITTAVPYSVPLFCWYYYIGLSP